MVIIIKDEKDHSYMKKITDGDEKIIFCLETSEIRLNAIYQKYD